MVIFDNTGAPADLAAQMTDLQADTTSGAISRPMTQLEATTANVALPARTLTGGTMEPGAFARAKAYVLAELAAATKPVAGVTMRYYVNPSDAPQGMTAQVSISEYASS